MDRCGRGLEKMTRELSLSERVIIAGERQDIPAMLASMDISVLISGSESLSNVILESMAAGVRLVATEVGGNPELISHGQTGFLVPPENDDLLVESLAQLIANPALRAQFSQAGQPYRTRSLSYGRGWPGI